MKATKKRCDLYYVGDFTCEHMLVQICFSGHTIHCILCCHETMQITIIIMIIQRFGGHRIFAVVEISFAWPWNPKKLSRKDLANENQRWLMKPGLTTLKRRSRSGLDPACNQPIGRGLKASRITFICLVLSSLAAGGLPWRQLALQSPSWSHICLRQSPESEHRWAPPSPPLHWSVS